MMIYTILFMPYRVAFVDDSESGPDAGMIVYYIVDFLFAADIIVTFFSAYEASDGTLHHHMSKIVKNYIKTYFFLDCVATYVFL